MTTTEDATSRRRIPSRLRTAIRWGVASVALALLVRFIAQNWQQLADEQLDPNWGMLVLSFAVLIVYLVGRVLAWHQITVHLGVRIPLPAAAASWFTSLLGKYLPGKVFLLLGRLDLYAAYGRSKVTTTVAFTIETLVSMLSSVYTILVALLFVDIDLGPRLTGPLLVLLLLLTASLHPAVMQRVLALVGRITKRELPPLEVSFPQMLLFVAVGTAVWLIFGAAFTVFTNAVFTNALFEVDAQLLLYLTGSISAASLLGILAIVAPSGLGVREGFLTLMLAQVMPAPAAAVVSLASRVWVTIGELVVIGVGGILARGSRPAKTPPPRDAAKNQASTEPSDRMTT